jgi:hypothetical protein
MANQLTVLNVSPMFKSKRVRYGLALSGNYVQVSNGGEVLAINSATGAFLPGEFWGYTGPQWGDPTQPNGGYTMQIIPGADGLHWILKVWSAPGTELAAGAYPAAITGDANAFVEFWGADFK